MKVKHTTVVLLSLGIGMFQSCKTKEKDVIPVEEGYVLGFRAQNGAATSSENDADYLLTVKTLMSGTISSTGNGIEQNGWCYYTHTGGTYLVQGYQDNNAVGYKVENGLLVEKGRFAFERMDCTNEVGDNKTLVSIGAPWGGGSYDCNIQLIDMERIGIASAKKHPLYFASATDSAKTRLNMWPTGTYVENGKLYVSFYPLNGTTWETPLTDTAYVSIFEYPSLSYIKTIKDTRTGPIGYYGDPTCIIKDENGNHYTLSNTSVNSGFTQSTKPSGILRINAGSDEFDKDYFFNVEGASGFKVLAAAYVSNGLAVARVVKDDPSFGAWGTFSYSGLQPCKMVILDLIKKTVTEVADVPMHGGQYKTPFLVENEKVYVSINAGTEKHIYQIDPKTAKGTKGAKIEGREIQAFYKY